MKFCLSLNAMCCYNSLPILHWTSVKMRFKKEMRFGTITAPILEIKNKPVKKQPSGINKTVILWVCVDHKKLWKILQEMGILDHLTCLQRNLYAGQEATVRNRCGTTVWFEIGKGIHQGNILSPCLFNLYAENITQNVGLDEAQLESRLLGEISITTNMQMTPPLWQKVKRN